MLKAIAATALSFAACPTAAVAASPALSAAQISARAEVEAAVRAVAAAYQANDYAKYFSYFDDDILIWAGPRGRWTKQDYVTRWSKRIQDGGGVASLSLYDLQMRISPKGDAVVATFLMPVFSRVPGGQPKPDSQASAKPDIIYNMTEVWFKNGNRWSMSHMYWTTQ